jgi:hypothetical protein
MGILLDTDTEYIKEISPERTQDMFMEQPTVDF